MYSRCTTTTEDGGEGLGKKQGKCPVKTVPMPLSSICLLSSIVHYTCSIVHKPQTNHIKAKIHIPNTTELQSSITSNQTRDRYMSVPFIGTE